MHLHATEDDALAIEDELFRQLIDSAPDAMVVVQGDGRIALVNVQAETLFGYTREELVGRPIETLIPERYHAAHVGHRTDYTDAPKLRPMGSGLQLFGRRKGGGEFPIEISLSPLTIQGRTLVSSAIRDVSARRRADQKFRELLEAAPDAMVIADADGRITLVNAQTERLFGYTRDELVGRPVESLVPTRYRAAHVHHRSGFVRDPKARGMGSGLDLFGLRKDASEFPVEISLSPIETEDGTLVSIAIRAISERRRAEADARLVSERLLSAVESFHGVLKLYDADDRLVMCNSAARALYSPVIRGPLLGVRLDDLVDASIELGLYASAGDAAALRGRLVDYHRDPKGTLDVLLASGRTLRITSRRTLEGGIVSTAIDVTDDVEKEAALRLARAEAEAASLAKSEFLSSMSHELRTPLNAILGFAQVLQRDSRSPLTAPQREKLDYVLRGGEHLLRLIDDVLDLSQIEAGRVMISPKPVVVTSALDEVRRTLEPLAVRSGVRLVVFSPLEPLPEIAADPTRFVQILINFGSNAIKYGRRGGRAEIRAELMENGRVRASVRDDGMGIALEKQDKIFQPFQRAGQETGSIEGTGIGLSISRRLAELMHGTVGFESRPNVGSEFWVELPTYSADMRVDRTEEAPRMIRSSLAIHTGDGFRVVYIEDNPSNIAFMQAVMDELPRVHLVTVPNAEVGVEVVRDMLPDAVIMDINLPGMNGYEATRILRDAPETSDIPVIALSAAAMVGDAKRVADVGFFRYLTKPVRVDELIDALECLLAPRAAEAE